MIIPNLFVIIHKPSGLFIPKPTGKHGRGGSHLEPTANVLPRLFETELGAKRFLSQWLRGKHVADYGWEIDDYSGRHYRVQKGITVIPQPHRIREEMEIVPVSINHNDKVIYK